MSVKKCPTCGFEIIQDANYCFNCGVVLKDPMPEIVYLKEEPEEAPVEEIEQPISEESVEDAIEQQESFEFGAEEEQECASEEDDDDNEKIEDEEKTRRIFWMPEWAFYSILLIIGILGIVSYKFISDPSWADKLNFLKLEDKEEVVQAEDSNVDKNLPASVTDAEYDDSVYTPLMNALDNDSTYHVVVMTLKSLESAQKIVDEGKYKNAYIVSDTTRYRIAVYNNPDKDNAQNYLNTVVRAEVPGAWVFHGPKK